MVGLLLENGAKTNVVNGVNKTAVQLGSFVGKNCVLGAHVCIYTRS